MKKKHKKDLKPLHLTSPQSTNKPFGLLKEEKCHSLKIILLYPISLHGNSFRYNWDPAGKRWQLVNLKNSQFSQRELKHCILIFNMHMLHLF